MRHARHLLPLLAALTATVGTAADEPRPAGTVDIEQTLRGFLVRSPYRISESARAGTIRYRVRLPGEPWSFPETAEQHVRVDGATTELTICADCGREAAPTPDELRRYLAPNDWVQSADRRIVAFAREARGGRVDATMNALVTAVQLRLNGAIDFREYQTATQALASRGGDCTEFAVLLAAAARARRIPARVVAGVSYASHFLGEKHAFSPHMWVQAWDGTRWKSYDAALGRFDAGHIALAVGDGSPDGFRGEMQAIARLQIVEAAGIVRDAPR